MLPQSDNVSCYVERQVAAHAAVVLDEGIRDTASFAVSRPDIEPIFKLYQAHGCWTWTTNWNRARNILFSLAATARRAPGLFRCTFSMPGGAEMVRGRQG